MVRSEADSMRVRILGRSWSRVRSLLLLLVLVVFVGACAFVAQHALDERYGAATVRDRQVQNNSATPEYHRDAKLILDKRCVACHACYDAPCQLQLGSFEGVDRGASKETVYDATRLLAADPSRLFVDASSTQSWRQRGFFPVLNERRQLPDSNRQASLLHKMLELKRANPVDPSSLLPDDIVVGTDGGNACSRLDQFDSFASKHPHRGMPYGLPAIAEAEYRTLSDWISAGAKVTERAGLHAAVLEKITTWEGFLNRPALKSQLMSRYLYEHLFLAHLYFGEPENVAPGEYFRLVRSSTPPGQPIKLISTRRPYDHPGQKRFYYRLWREQATIVAKTHMPYALNPARMARWQTLFVDNEAVVSELPSYETRVAANPFEAFKDIPVDSRYRFLLDEAEFSIMSFIKGPVCRGQVAVNVINDRFWVFFIDPDHPSVQKGSKLIGASSDLLRLPIEAGSNASPLSVWTEYAALEKQRVQSNEAFLKQEFGNEAQISLDLIWDGYGSNSNAALTVFRHLDSATVAKGLIGSAPKSAWVIDYTLLEKIHYLLVAGYDVYGNLGHNVNSRLYMDFLRMDGEFSFLSFLPIEERVKERDHWYRNAELEVEDFIRFDRDHFNVPSAVEYASSNPKQELFAKLTNRLAPVLNRSYDLKAAAGMSSGVLEQLAELAAVKGRAVSFLPEVSYLTIVDGTQSQTVTLIRNTALTNVAYLFGESDRRVPDEDTLTVVTGLLGSYPNAFYRLNAVELGQFVASVKTIATETDYSRLADRFAVRRTAADFWAHSDFLHSQFARNQPLQAGILDYNRLENR